jgi:hypothetical protein
MTTSAECAAIWVAMLTEEIRELTDVATLGKMAARLRDMAELAEDRAAELGPDLGPFIMRSESERIQ